MHNWLEIAKKIQAIAQAGLSYPTGVYDKERYEELLKLSTNIFENITNIETPKLNLFLNNENGYKTPKIDIRAIIIQNNKILLVKETSDNKWSVPGGWADVGFSPSEIAIKETKEETGLDVKAKSILAVFDKNKHQHPQSIFYVYKIFIECEIIGGELKSGIETSKVKFFSKQMLPELSKARVTNEQLNRIFNMIENKTEKALFD